MINNYRLKIIYLFVVIKLENIYIIYKNIEKANKNAK